MIKKFCKLRSLLLAAVALLPLAASAQDSCSITLPYTEDFESYTTTGGTTLATCWTRVDTFWASSSAAKPNIQSTSAYYGHGKVLDFSELNGSNTAITMSVATPHIATALNSLELAFDVKGDPLQVYAVGDLNDLSTYTLLGTYNTTGATTTWQSHELHTDTIAGVASTSGYILFKVVCSSRITAQLDNISISALTGCNRPASVSVAQIQPYSAEVSWPAVTGVSSYKVYYGTVDNIDLASVDTVSGTTLVLDELEPNTLYYVWVTSVCGATAESDPRATSFTTQLSCYPPVGIHQSSTGFNAVSYAWEFDPRGNSATEVLVVLHDHSDSTMEDYVENSSNLNSHFVQDLDPTHEYTISFYAVCGDDTAEVVTLPVVFKVCGQSELAALSGNYDMHPMPVGFNYGYTQMMYPAEVFLDMDTITGLALHRAMMNNNGGSSVTRTLSIWMGNTTDTSHTTVVPVTGMTQVASDVSYTFPVQEWDTIYFTTPFVYTPGHNVIVTIDDNTGTHVGTSSAQWLWHEQYWKTIYKNHDSNNPNPNSISGATYTQRCPDMQFVGACNTDFSCVAPIVAIGEFDSMMAEVNWLESLGSRWILEYRISGTTNWTLADTVTTAPYFLTGLQPATQYDVRMAVLCDDDEMRYGDVVSFSTLCALMEMPFHFTNNDMCAAVDNGFAPCWDNSQYFYRGRVTENYRCAVYNAGNGEWFMLPPIAEPLSGARLRCKIASSDQGKVKVGIASLANCSDVVWVDTIDIPAGSPATSNDEYVVYLDRYTGEGNRVVVSPIVNNNYHYIYFFDFHVEPIEACRPVADLVLDSASASSLSVSWTPMSAATQWAVYVNGAQRTVVNGQPHCTLTGLSPYTLYQVSVRSLCGDDSSAIASEHFRTACTGEQCTFTLDAHSSNGEGWHGAKLHIYAGGEMIENFTMRQGSNLSGTYSVCANMPILLKWLSGSTDSICSFELRNAAGDILYLLERGPGHTDTLYVTNDICSAEPLPACTNRYASATQTACDSYQWRGRTLTASGTYSDTVTGAVVGGCDSIYTLTLTINQSVRVTLDTTAGQSLSWHGNTYTESGTYSWTGTAANGCDSVVVMNLVITGSQGIDTPESLSLELYPNPTTGKVMLVADEIEKVEVFDAAGRTLLVVRDSDVVDLSHLVSGLYTLRITMTEGTAVRRVLKY